MRMLVLGGTVFLSHAVAAQAVARGHDVTCAARGHGGPVPEGARHVRLDRETPDWTPLQGLSWDAVVDVARRPSWVCAALDALAERTGRWVFVSTASVYADQATPGQRADEAPVLPPAGDDVDETSPEHYGELKVACERLVTDRGGGASLVVRAGLIVGPGDPSGRFAYWPDRMAQASTVLAPGAPDELVQMVDVRDLAAWLVASAESGLTGVFDGKAPPMTRGEMLAAVARGVGADPDLVWVPQEFLLEYGVEPWSGPRSLPLWVPLPEYAGFMSRDATAAAEAGLVVRPVEETARDTLAWLRRTPGAPVTGLTAGEHREVLHDWGRVHLTLS